MLRLTVFCILSKDKSVTNYQVKMLTLLMTDVELTDDDTDDNDAL